VRELGIAFLLILLNGLIALSELATVSARKARLKTTVGSGRAGAATALKLAEEPGRFLSTVQIGITLVGILAGAFSGAFGLRSFSDQVAFLWRGSYLTSSPVSFFPSLISLLAFSRSLFFFALVRFFSLPLPIVCLSGSGSLIETTPCRRGSNPQPAD
jgi:CBS domain containing-hemolysin-like protein